MTNSTYSQRIAGSAYRNVYWFARYLIDTDKYGALGRSKTDLLLKTVAEIERLLSDAFPSEQDTCDVGKRILLTQIRSLTKQGSKASRCAENFAEILDEEIRTVDDLSAFCLAMRHIVAPINSALALIPSDDKEYVLKSASAFMEVRGERAAGELIAWWDKAGIKGCLDAERAEVVCAFAGLVNALEQDKKRRDTLDDYLIMTAFIQEFERRLGQKRKARGGGSLEDSVDFLFSLFNFPSTKKPSHFDHDIEVDKWFKCSDGWVIGISCKRTLRERWKQLSQADRGTLSHHKIKEIWHVITLDRDLSDDKIVRLGEQSHVFYLMDSSEVYKRCKDHQGMRDYVRPLSSLIQNIRERIRGV